MFSFATASFVWWTVLTSHLHLIPAKKKKKDHPRATPKVRSVAKRFRSAISLAVRLVAPAVLCCVSPKLHPQGGASSSHSRVRCPPRRVHCGDVWRFFWDVSITDHTWDVGSLPLHMGGLGIRSADAGLQLFGPVGQMG